MRIRKCDRCGIEINEYPLQQAILPRYSIVAKYSINVVEVDLCDKCQRDFEKWLHSESESKENRT